MKKWKACGLAVILMALINSATGQQVKLLRHQHFGDYSSASGIEWHRGRLYVMGDDAPTLMILNRRLKEKTRTRLYSDTVQRIPSSQKHDLESAFWWISASSSNLVLVPSFSTASRNKVVLISPRVSKALPRTVVDTLSGIAISNLNIEGSTAFKEDVLLAQRNLTISPGHSLFLYRFDTLNGFGEWKRTISLTVPQTPALLGISGLCYAPGMDVLFVTFSSEATTDPTKDGLVGDSYMGWIENWETQAQKQSVTVDGMVKLTTILRNSTVQKIESVTLRKAARHKAWLYLAADNDNGTSDIFSVSVKLRR